MLPTKFTEQIWLINNIWLNNRSTVSYWSDLDSRLSRALTTAEHEEINQVIEGFLLALEYARNPPRDIE